VACTVSRRGRFFVQKFAYFAWQITFCPKSWFDQRFFCFFVDGHIISFWEFIHEIMAIKGHFKNSFHFSVLLHIWTAKLESALLFQLKSNFENL